MKEIRLFLAALNKKGVRLYLEQNKLKSQSPENGISEEERAYIKNNKQTIIQYLESLNKSYSEIQVSSLSKRNLSVGELSFAQRRLWILDCLQGGSSEYNMPMAYNIAGELNLDLVSDVFRTILMRHEILRTVYIENDGEVQQEICHIDRVNFNIRVEDLSDLNGNVLEEQVRTLIEADITSPFNLSEELMLRVSYINKGSGAGILLFNMHHIASDGWSMEVLVKEFFELYYAYSQQKANPLPELELQYMDYACWQREYLEGEVFESQLDYWKQQLNELPAVHSLPLDYARPTVKQHQGAMVAGELSDTIAQRLLLLAKSYQLTPFMLLHGALCMLLSRHSNSQDIVIGTPVANRLQAELEPLIGFFVNTLVLRVDTDHKDLSAYLAHVRQVHLSAQAHQDIPFEQLVEQLKIPRSNAHSPLFQIMMITENDYGLSGGTDKTSFTLPNLDIQRRESDLIQAKFDLNINLSVSDHGVSLQWIYDTSLFTHSHITQLNEHLCCLLEELSHVVERMNNELDRVLSENDELRARLRGSGGTFGARPVPLPPGSYKAPPQPGPVPLPIRD